VLNQSLGDPNFGDRPQFTQQWRRLSCPGHESLTLAFCLATRRCKNFGPSFLQRHFPARAGRFCRRRSLGRTFAGKSGVPDPKLRLPGEP
jgi:hypothetical protein